MRELSPCLPADPFHASMSVSYPNIATYRSRIQHHSQLRLLAIRINAGFADEKWGGRGVDGDEEADHRLDVGTVVKMALEYHRLLQACQVPRGRSALVVVCRITLGCSVDTTQHTVKKRGFRTCDTSINVLLTKLLLLKTIHSHLRKRLSIQDIGYGRIQARSNLSCQCHGLRSLCVFFHNTNPQSVRLN